MHCALIYSKTKLIGFIIIIIIVCIKSIIHVRYIKLPYLEINKKKKKKKARIHSNNPKIIIAKRIEKINLDINDLIVKVNIYANFN